jgi:lysophospholipase L1-like esterase
MNERTLRAASAALTLGLAAGAGAQDFTTYMTVGDSLAAGYTSNSLIEAAQVNSVPALLARQGSAPDFQQPLIGDPGIPPILVLQSLIPSPVIVPKSATPGQPRNAGLARPYNNLAVPGATAADALLKTTDNGGFHDLILRGRGSQVQQAVGSRPTFVTLWIGNNDVLGAALRGQAVDGVTLTPTAIFRQVYGAIVTALRATGAPVVAANLPDPTVIPFVTTIRPYLVNPATGQPVVDANGNRVPLLGPSGPLSPNAFVTLAASTLLAQGTGIPQAAGGNGQPLPDQVILDEAEVGIIRDHVVQNNQAIRDICGAASIPIVDVNSLLNEVATSGRVVGGVELTAAFLTGGIFSYDGVHPTPLGYALVANEWIRVINEELGGELEPVDLGPFLGVTSGSAAAAASSPLRRTPPFEFSAEAYRALLDAFPTLDRR